MNFNEDFLHFIWQFSLFNTINLTCVNGEQLRVLSPGILNKHAGPDFSGARLLIDETMWVGHVEVHLKSSDWLCHGHQHDNFYDAVVLHVVYKHDCPIQRTNGTIVPVLVLEGLFSSHFLFDYKRLMTTANDFPCQKHIGTLPSIITHAFLSRIAIERLEQKSEEVFQKLNRYKGDWEQTFYCFVARNFGFKVNAIPFDLLVEILPRSFFFKDKHSALQVEALLFGQAGFLDQEFFETYPLQLQAEYAYLVKKYNLKPMKLALWKFLRMRPQNFPTIRLAQFAALVVKSGHLFSKVVNAPDLPDLFLLFNQLPVNQYWATHYHFNKKARNVVTQPGVVSIQGILINSVCLFLFCYGKYTNQPELIERALSFLEKIPTEKNGVVNQYRQAGVKITNAFASQAVLQLNKYYCNQKKCLNCAIGIKILRK